MRWALLVVGALLCPGCGSANTEPSGEALKAMLAKEGNPTAWAFHVPPARLVAFLERDEYRDLKLGSGASEFEWWELSGDGTSGATEPRLLARHRLSERHGDVEPYSYLCHKREKAYAVPYRVKLCVKLTAVPQGTRVEIEGREAEIRGNVTYIPTCNPFECLNPHGSGLDSILSEHWQPALSDTVEEYQLLLAFGKAFGEQGMPLIRYPKIEVLP